MIYKDFPSIVARISKDKELTIQAIVIVTGIFLALMSTALFGEKIWLLIESVSIIIFSILVLVSRKSLVNLSEYGPMKEVSGRQATKWGVYYLFFGFLLMFLYFFI